MSDRSTEDLIWAAGVVSCFGIFLISRHAKPVMMLQIKSKRHPGMVKRMARIARKKVVHKKSGDEIVISHLDLDIFWALIFKNVTPERELEYSSMRKEVMKQRAAYDAKIEYQKERAAAQPSSRESLRKRDEALYHNQDSAVQVVDGFIEAEMATSYDLEQARIRREKAQAAMTHGMTQKGRR